MTILLDTNVLARLANTSDIQHIVAVAAIVELHRQGHSVHVTPQNIIEFRSLATRPTAVNGLGLNIADAEKHIGRFLADFPLLPDTPDVFPAWNLIVTSHGVVGKQVHDARLVAVCHVHRVTHLLTFNIRHFTRIATSPPGILLLDPATL